MKRIFYFLARAICVIALCIPTIGNAQSEIFTTSGTFTVPEGVTSITVEAWGGGGCGSTISDNLAGGGGGGGAYARKVVAVTPLATYTVTVGQGSISGSESGGDSWFIDTATIVAKGGASASDNSATAAVGGQASLSIGDVTFDGGNGADGTGSIAGGGGSSAGSTATGNAATGATGGLAPSEGGIGGDGRIDTSGPGINGGFPGGGGGGAYRVDGGIAVGGTGGNGLVRLTWIGAEINVFGNDTAINNGDTTTSVDNWTEFEATSINLQSSRTFQIESSGTASLSLTISTITISGDNASDFTLTSSPTPSINPGASSFFTVSFSPSEVGLRTAVISIPNNDDDENPFTFAISGMGMAEDGDGDGFSADIDCDDTNPDVWQNLEFYVDADGDGYGTGELTLACAGDPGTAPVGFSLTADDCDDTAATTNPGAVEIDFNGMDDNCDGTIDEGSQLLSQVLPSQCGQTFQSINALVGAVSFGGGVDGYRFRCTNNTTMTTEDIDSNVPHFNMTSLASYDYSTTYTISVMLRRNGIWLNYFGPSCEVSTPAILGPGGSASIVPAQCGSTVTSLSTLVATNSLLGVTGYRFQITNMTDPSAPNQVQTYENNHHWFSISNLDTFTYGTTYAVEVAVKTNGDFTNFGSTCTISTPNVPGIVNPGIATSTGTFFYTQSKGHVTSYRFELTNTTDMTVNVIDRPVHYFSFTQVPGFMPGTQYSVRVALMTTGIWSPYGPTQLVTAPGAAKVIVKDTEPTVGPFEVVGYPNPFNDRFSLELDAAENTNIQIKAYDMMGRLLEDRDISSEALETQSFGAEYPSGVYNVIVSEGDNVKTLRMVKR
ncbi:choice-of-anchor D domain-containing protein [Flavobacterium sp. MAH-1]|uniref:Choice-of-anchor D domain-containing protein n=1 Tax=Flavobacterium agri TaxID=2743471 RepID=A0A7Y8Y3C0_9FLAO|nr:choice-of-anchor D domain-containing protein [Flavobacterium agri]NUY81810.1 choice-of-anchor D domain-containing protein [Flavobacterium agri]NYA71834.1 choice-of-anchor D domain-containing protein [Flavobacterium agri]